MNSFMRSALAVIPAFAVLASAEEAQDLDHPWESGLYSTVTIPVLKDPPDPPGVKTLMLTVESFKKNVAAKGQNFKGVKVRATLQEKPAPLVFLLPGTFGKKSGPEINLWMGWLATEGYHVLTSDSTFQKSFTEASMLGAAGCIEAEAEAVAEIMHAFLERPEVKGKVTLRAVVGMSYGGTVALSLSRLARQGKVPFALDAVQAYSPPLSMKTTLNFLDREFALNNQPKTSIMWDLDWSRKPPAQANLDPKLMRAAIAVFFRDQLGEVVEANDRFFDDELKRSGVADRIPKDTGEVGAKFTRDQHAEACNFRRYVEEIAAPFWTCKGRIRNVDDLYRQADLEMLLRESQPQAKAFVAANDPLNEDAALAKLRTTGPREKLVVLPRGGHIGYYDSGWMRKSLTGILKDLPKETLQKGPEIFTTPEK